MWKRMVPLFMAAFVLILAACSNTNNHQSTENVDMNSNNDSGNDMNGNNDSEEMDVETEEADSDSNDNAESTENDDRATADSKSDRMVIYTARMTITINDFQQTQSDMQSLLDEVDGYIVNSNVSNSDDHHQRGELTMRVPQTNFNDFLDEIEAIAEKVKERNINGEDVTKEYVDLESRLAAKEDVKKRLNSLMEEAEDTDALLDISNKLGDTQEEIESLKGQMEYLENHSSMSTVTVTMTEDNVDVASVKKWDDLNTWEKTKKVLVGSINAIITFFSGIVTFLVGLSPILVPLLIIAGVIYGVYRKRRNKEK